MAKRLTDIAKWDKLWFRKLSPIYKCFWIYICDRCDFCGIWEVDFESAKHYIGEKLDIEAIKKEFNKQFKVLNGGSRWLIIDFIPFQYGAYNETNTMFNPIKNNLSKYGVSMGDIWGINPLTVTVKDKVKVKVKDNNIDFIASLKNNQAYKSINIDTELAKMDAWLLTPKGQGRKKTQRFILNWLNRVETVVETPKQEYKKADPNCKLCKGKGEFFAQGTSKFEVCSCRIK